MCLTHVREEVSTQGKIMYLKQHVFDTCLKRRKENENEGATRRAS